MFSGDSHTQPGWDSQPIWWLAGSEFLGQFACALLGLHTHLPPGFPLFLRSLLSAILRWLLLNWFNVQAFQVSVFCFFLHYPVYLVHSFCPQWFWTIAHHLLTLNFRLSCSFWMLDLAGQLSIKPNVLWMMRDINDLPLWTWSVHRGPHGSDIYPSYSNHF